jgi:hypothetical protein
MLQHQQQLISSNACLSHAVTAALLVHLMSGQLKQHQ